MSLKSFTSSAARRVRMISGWLVVLLVATFSAGSAYAQTVTTYSGEVTVATGAFSSLTPVATPVGGPVKVNDAALAAGSIGIADITSIDVNVGGFCFSTEMPSACPMGGADVPITSIDSAAITGTGGTLGGSFSVTAFSPTFNVSIPIMFDLTAGTFSAEGGALGTVSGTGTLVAPAGMTAPEITTTPANGATIAFGDVLEGATVLPQTITITNDGTADLTLSSIALSGMSANLSAPNSCGNFPAVLAPMANCVVTLTLTTVSPEVINETVTIMSDDADEATVTVNVTANIQAPAALTSSAPMGMPLLLDSVAIGGTPSKGMVTVTNSGGVAATLGTATMPAAPFALTANDTCSGQSLGANASCTIEVEFTPVTAGMFASSFTIAFTNPAVSTEMFVASSTLDPAATPSANQPVIPDTMVNGTSTGTLTITNSGAAPLIVTSVSGLTAPFAVIAPQTCTTAPVAPMGTCIITVQFSPTTAGMNQTGTLSIVSNDPSSPLSVAVTANATEQLLPNVMVTPASVTFATPLLIGASSAPETITVRNTGTANLAINSVTIAPDPLVDFVLVNNCVSPLAPMATCTLDVTFAPMNAGPLTATVSINTDDPDTPVTPVVISGTGVTPEPNIMLSAASLDLGVVTVTESSTGMVTVTNTGTANLNISSVTIPAGGFTQTNTCAAPVVPMGTCIITVTFAPTTATTIMDTLTIVSNDPDPADMMSTVSLTGRGVLAPEPNITSAVTQLDLGSGLFGIVQNGSVQISNNGNAVLTISAINVTGMDAAAFTAGQDCVGMLAIGANCVVTVQFNPGAPAGGKAASLGIVSNDVGSPTYSIGLLGNAQMPVPQAVFSTMAIAFANTTVGQLATEMLTLSNTGTGALTVNSVTLTGMGSVFMVSSETCTMAPVAVNGSCNVTVTFMPDAESGFTGTLTINSDDPTTPVAPIAISGTGVAQPVANISADVMSLAFGNRLFGDPGMLTVTVTNTGTADLTISGATIPAGDFAATTACGVLMPAATCTVTVTYAPTVAGAVTSTLTIASNDADTPALAIPLSGFGVAPEPEIGVSATALTLGPLVAGNTDTMSLTVTNSGMANLTIGSITVSGTDQALFTQTSDCATVAMNASCTVMVTYAPLVAGSATAVLTIVSNDADEGSVAVTLTGTATPVPMPMPSVPATVEVGEVGPGQPSMPTIPISNNGTADLVISSVTLEGANAADFTQTSTCTTVVPGDTCTIGLMFTPSVPGTATVNVVIVSNDAASPSTTVAVTAFALLPVPVFSSTDLDVGSVRIGETGSSTFTITNSGNTDLIITGVVLSKAPEDFTVANGCGTVVPAASCTITVTFTPKGTGTSTATMTITTNDPKAASVAVALSAAGAPREEIVVNVSSEGGSKVGSFGGLELLALVLFAAFVRRGKKTVSLPQSLTRVLSIATARAVTVVLVPIVIAFGLVSAPVALADNHEEAGYWYVGAGFGNSDAQADQGPIQRDIEAAGVMVTAVTIDDTDSGFKVYGGFQATEHLAIEAGYVDLGEAAVDLRLGNVALNQLPVISRSVSGNLSLLGSGAFGAIVLRESVTDNVGVFARVGLFTWEVDTRIGGTTSMGALSINETESGTDLTLGIGIEAWFGQGKKLGLRGEWERYEIGGQDAEFLSLGGMFRF